MPDLIIRNLHVALDRLITTDSRTLTLVHLGRLDVSEAERSGSWCIDGPPALVRALPKWGGMYSRFADVRPVQHA